MNAIMLNDFTELNEYPNLLVCKSAKPTPQKFTNEQWIQFQEEDPIIGQFCLILESENVIFWTFGNFFDFNQQKMNIAQHRF